MSYPLSLLGHSGCFAEPQKGVSSSPRAEGRVAAASSEQSSVSASMVVPVPAAVLAKRCDTVPQHRTLATWPFWEF